VEKIGGKCYIRCMKANKIQREMTELLSALQEESPRGFMRAVQYASSRSLNNVAYRSRSDVQTELRRRLTIRAKGLIRAMIMYKKSAPRDPLWKQVSSVGTLSRDRFTGWVEQHDHAKSVDRRKRIFTAKARISSNKKRAVRKKYRLFPSVDIPQPDKNSASDDIAEWLEGSTREWQKAGRNVLFMLPKGHPHKKMAGGGVWYYTARGNKLKFIATRPKYKKRIRPNKFVDVGGMHAMGRPPFERADRLLRAFLIRI